MSVSSNLMLTKLHTQLLSKEAAFGQCILTKPNKGIIVL